MSTPIIQKIPNETVQRIASFLSSRDIKNLVRGCPFLHPPLYRQTWPTVFIHGIENRLLCELRKLLSKAVDESSPLKFIKFVLSTS
jgi:hypothetical protein